MINRFGYLNWNNNYPSNIFEYLSSPCSRGLRILNFIVQKIFRINGEYPFMVHFTSIVNGKVIIGKNVAQYFANSSGCYIQGINGVEIGDDTIFAPGIKIISANHSKENYKNHDKCRSIVIGKNCWLGTNCVILPGVVLGDNVIVAAGSVVTKSFDSNSVIAGVPARIIQTKK